MPKLNYWSSACREKFLGGRTWALGTTVKKVFRIIWFRQIFYYFKLTGGQALYNPLNEPLWPSMCNASPTLVPAPAFKNSVY